MSEDYRTRPCPHCGTRPDETEDPMGTLVNCLITSVADIARAHASTIGRFTPGRVFWYAPEAAWCRVRRAAPHPNHEGLIPIEYAGDDPDEGFFYTDADPETLLDWDPDDPRLPDGGAEIWQRFKQRRIDEGRWLIEPTHDEKWSAIDAEFEER